ncbi:Sulphatase-modifying factor domain protein [Candidatus Magnetomorum sp. HK-1]|nr:Sulphatase-modifying factor domain protein [Candidatus Magnetomorum sp. HK-1]
MKCPVCDTQYEKKNERICQTCGWEFKVYVSDISAAEQAVYEQQFKIYQRNYKAQTVLKKENRELKMRCKKYQKKLKQLIEEYHKLKDNHKSVPIQSTQSEKKNKHKRVNKEQPLYDSKFKKDFPDLKRDPFETHTEFQDRIHVFGAFQVGSATLIKKNYQYETGKFPIKIQWNEWSQKHFEMPENDAWIIAERDLAVSIYENHQSYPIVGKCYVNHGIYLSVYFHTDQLAFDLKDKLSIKKKKWVEPYTQMEFIYVPGGSFQMGDQFGDDNEKPVHKVTLDPFFIGKYPVTQGQWTKVMGKNPSEFKKGDDYPVECVSWNDTQEYMDKLSQKSSGHTFRLPTEAEWEYAARSGGKKEKYAGGNDIEKVSWYSGNSQKSTHPVGEMDDNGIGLYDMSGNVWEWCEDWYNKNAYQNHASHNPLFIDDSSGLRVLRGGSWCNNARICRAAYRNRNTPDYRFDNAGFRLVFSPRSVSGQIRAR